MVELQRRSEGRETVRRDRGVPLICPVRDELALLPHFLSHYRSLGVRHFIFIDNGSRDGGAEYLADQPDCILYQTFDSYRASGFGVDWINAVIEMHNLKGWVIYVDIDEHLILPTEGENALEAYCAETSRSGYDAVCAMMLDMYPQTNFLEVAPDPTVPLVETMSWFDTDYVIRAWPSGWRRGDSDRRKPQILGGPRCRLLSNLQRERRRGALNYLVDAQVERFVDLVPEWGMPLLARCWAPQLAALQKTPLNYVAEDFRYLTSHSATNRRLSRELLVLLHFKFCSELQNRIRMSETEGNHHRRGLHYRQLRLAIDRTNGSLMYSGSRRYEGPASLADAGLLGDAAAPAWLDRTEREYRATGR